MDTLKKKMQLSALERETIILFSDDGKTCDVYTCSRPIMTKLDKLCKSNPDSYRLISKDSISSTYSMDKRLISFRTPKVMAMTDEHRAAASNRMKKIKRDR